MINIWHLEKDSLIDTGKLQMHKAHPCRTVEEAEHSCFEIKFLQADSLPELLQLQNVIAANLPCPEIFMLHDDLYLREIMRHERSVIGVTTQEELIAFSFIRVPGLANDNLGRDINLPEEELCKVAHLQAAAVHPAYRGNGLQRKLTFAHLDVIEDMGYEHACCTVSPKNPVSLANYLSCGLVIEGLRPKMQGWWRFILHRNIQRENCPDLGGAVDMNESGFQREERRIRISDIEGQLDLLRRGSKGYKISSLSDGVNVYYAKS
jgi:GNAT superfamily N-acetyltransferase